MSSAPDLARLRELVAHAARRVADDDRWAFQAVIEDGSLIETYRVDYGELREAAVWAQGRIEELAVERVRLERYLRHEVICGVVGGYGRCTCGLDDARGRWGVTEPEAFTHAREVLAGYTEVNEEHRAWYPPELFKVLMALAALLAHAESERAQPPAGQSPPADHAVGPPLGRVLLDDESERAQLGELLVRAVEACPSYLAFATDIPAGAYAIGKRGPGNNKQWERGDGPTLPDALRALLAKVEGA